jgi:hypothetical protein
MAARKTKPPGRSRGSKNLVGATAKENFLAVFTRLGGTAAMAEWAKENRTDFYKLYARLIPTEVGANINVAPMATVEPLPKDCTAAEAEAAYLRLVRGP